MDIALILIGIVLMLIGIAGSFVPIIPGPLTSWIGLFLLHNTSVVEFDWNFLSLTFILAVIVLILDYLTPIWGTKLLGGTKFGVIGSTIGLIIGLLFGPIGIIFGPFIGAFAGEFSNNSDTKLALRAALGSFIGFFTGVILKLLITIVYLMFFVKDTWMIVGKLF
tara:strand:+ start:28 stop:522 length:495 start_codon:yes stop_codon:yes gene_type:complete